MTFLGTSLTTQQAVLDTLAIDRQRGIPQYRQLYQQLRTLLLRRALRPGMRLPSTRALSSDLGTARNTVVAVYEQLATEGFIETSHGARARVADLPMSDSGSDRGAPAPLSESFSRRGRALVNQEHSWAPEQGLLFQPGMPAMKEFPFSAWRRLLSARIKPNPSDVFGYHSFGGHQPLREAIASYVEAFRSVRSSASQVIVTSGAQGALTFSHPCSPIPAIACCSKSPAIRAPRAPSCPRGRSSCRFGSASADGGWKTSRGRGRG